MVKPISGNFCGNSNLWMESCILPSVKLIKHNCFKQPMAFLPYLQKDPKGDVAHLNTGDKVGLLWQNNLSLSTIFKQKLIARFRWQLKSFQWFFRCTKVVPSTCPSFLKSREKNVHYTIITTFAAQRRTFFFLSRSVLVKNSREKIIGDFWCWPGESYFRASCTCNLFLMFIWRLEF